MLRRSSGLALALVLSSCFEDLPPPVGDHGSSSSSSTTATPESSSEVTSIASTGEDGDADTTTATTNETASSSESTTAEPGTSASTTDPAPFCGDGILGDDEMCDGGRGCDDACNFEDYRCNPLNDAGCPEAFRCGASDVDAESFSCQVPGTGLEGEWCSGVPENDGGCAAGLTCIFNFSTPLCDESNCCVAYCDLLAPACPEGQACRAFFVNPVGFGLEHLGFCGEPL